MAYKVYQISNTQTGMSYIGRTHGALSQRLWKHLNSKKIYCRKLHEAVIENGKCAFNIQLLAEANTREEANSLEEELIKELRTIWPHGYNLMSGGQKGCRHHPESSERIAKSRGGQVMTGKAARGVPRGPRPKEVGRNISKAKKGRPNGLLGKKKPGMKRPAAMKPVVATNLKTGEELYFLGVQLAVEALKAKRPNVVAALKGRRVSAWGYSWRYVA